MTNSYLTQNQQNPTKNLAVFLDRDGVIINDKEGYIHEVSKLKFIDGSIDALKLLQSLEYKLVIITNQAGIAKGRFSEEEYYIFTRAYLKILEEENIHIEKVYYCPHFKGSKLKKYNIDCECRKPKPGLLERAIKELNINIKDSYIIGDKSTDLEMAKDYPSIKKIGVLSGEGSIDELKKAGADFIFNNLLEFSQYLYKIKTK